MSPGEDGTVEREPVLLRAELEGMVSDLRRPKNNLGYIAEQVAGLVAELTAKGIRDWKETQVTVAWKLVYTSAVTGEKVFEIFTEEDQAERTQAALMIQEGSYITELVERL